MFKNIYIYMYILINKKLFNIYILLLAINNFMNQSLDTNKSSENNNIYPIKSIYITYILIL